MNDERLLPPMVDHLGHPVPVYGFPVLVADTAPPDALALVAAEVIAGRCPVEPHRAYVVGTRDGHGWVRTLADFRA